MYTSIQPRKIVIESSNADAIRVSADTLAYEYTAWAFINKSVPIFLISHLPQIVLKKRILIANYLTIRILFGAANGIRTRDPQLGKLMLYQLSYCRISKTETKVIYIFQPTKYKQTIFTITIKISALLFISTALCISCVWINRSLSPIKGL